MRVIVDMNENYQKAYLTLLEQSADWLKAMRAEYFDKFMQQGFPSRREENWKYTNIAALADVPFTMMPATKHVLAEGLLENYRMADNLLVFINGQFSSQYSSIKSLPKDVLIGNIAAAVKDYPQLLQEHLYKNSSQQGLQQLNLALMTDGAFIYVPDNMILKENIQLLFITENLASSSMQHLRNLIMVGKNATVNLLETYLGDTEQKYFNNSVTQIYAHENSQVNFYKIQQEARQAYHIANIEIDQQAWSKVATYSFSFGSELARDDLHVNFYGQGAECALYGLYLCNEHQHIDHHTRVDHHVAHCQSYELYKGVLADKSTAVFNGKVIVHPGAQQTQTRQINQNLLLSRTAEINTKPELEIYADDVQCTHGATVGQIDEQALFYLRSRGIEEKTALKILMYAFVDEIIENLPETIKKTVRNYLKQKLATITFVEAM